MSWPNKKKLLEAVEMFENFREMCEMQFDLGYVVNMQFPSKHHINKIMSLEYLQEDPEVIRAAYGEALLERAIKLIPNCKAYVTWIRGAKRGDSKVSSVVSNKEHRIAAPTKDGGNRR